MESIRVKDFMSASLVTLRPDQPVLDAIHALVSHRISGAPVVDQRSNIVGVLSERDCLRLTLSASYHGDSAGLVSDFMSTDVSTVEADMSIIDLAEKFLTQPYRRYPVIKKTRLVGIISRRDVLRALLAHH